MNTKYALAFSFFLGAVMSINAYAERQFFDHNFKTFEKSEEKTLVSKPEIEKKYKSSQADARILSNVPSVQK